MLGTRLNVSVSGGGTAGVKVSTGSGAVSSGFTLAFGEGFAVGVGLDFGLAVGVGEGETDSAGVTGVLAWNGVEAASCARTNAAAANNRLAKNNERMMRVPKLCAR